MSPPLLIPYIVKAMACPISGQAIPNPEQITFESIL
jgi:hypothetical protein